MATYLAAFFFEPYIWQGQQVGWYFLCPKCRMGWCVPTDRIDKLVASGMLPNPPSHELHWKEEGPQLDSMTLSPSVVCRTPGCTGHYWVRNGSIIDV